MNPPAGGTTAAGAHRPLSPAPTGRATCASSLRLTRQLGVGGPTLLPSPGVENEHGLAVQPVGRPVRSDVAAVPPDGARLHAAHRLPDVLALLNFTGTEKHRSTRRDDFVGDGRCHVIDPSARPEKHGERSENDQRERGPKPSCVHERLFLPHRGKGARGWLLLVNGRPPPMERVSRSGETASLLWRKVPACPPVAFVLSRSFRRPRCAARCPP